MPRKSKLTTRSDTPPFGLRMTDRMSALGLDDQDVADKTGLNYDTIRAIRRRGDKNPRTETIAKVAEVLGVTTDWLARGKGATQASHGENVGTSHLPPTHTVNRVQELKRELAEAYAAFSGDPVERVNITITIR